MRKCNITIIRFFLCWKAKINVGVGITSLFENENRVTYIYIKYILKGIFVISLRHEEYVTCFVRIRNSSTTS